MNQTLPQNRHAECAVLGGVLLRNDKLTRVRAILAPEDFYHPAHQLIFQVMLDIADRGQAVDPLTVGAELVRREQLGRVEGSQDYLVDLLNQVPTAENIEHYARIVHELAAVRMVITAAREISAQGMGDYGDAREYLDQALLKIQNARQRLRADRVRRFNEVVVDTISNMTQLRHGTRTRMRGLPTGFAQLDRILGGIRAHELVTLAGRPAMGKSALAQNIVLNIARGGDPVLVFALEMGESEYAERAFADVAKVDLSHITRGNFSDASDWQRIRASAAGLAALPIWMDSKSTNIRDIYGVAIGWAADHVTEIGHGMVVVDYLQLVRGTNRKDTREQQVSEITRALKQIAKDIHVPVLALAQLNRELEKRENKRPMLSDIRESGSAEQDSDVVLFVYREEYYKPNLRSAQGKAEVIVAKRRNGVTGTAELRFVGAHMRFEDLPDLPAQMPMQERFA
jgi:replicative DNA helicase